MNNKFAQKLKELRIEKNVRQHELANILGISARAVSFYENGERECDFDTLIKICKYFNVTTDYILGLSDY
jgi:transcriptional regulator with XRE-family HTH domain